MASISKVLVVQHDRRAADAVRLGFEREGATVVAVASADEAAALVDADTVLVVAGADGADPARALLARLTKATGAESPILWVGNGVRREDAWAAGADEVLAQPAYLRDVVTIGKLLAGRKRGHRTQISGDLGDYFGVFYLVRALAATGRSGVLTLVRGLRRGEMRFFEGEITSAHMGGLHGQAGFHQLLLWTEARFEWRHEPVVKRGQIPMPHDEVLGQAERFLTDIREVAGGLSPAAVYEQNPAKVSEMARKLPTEVHGVLRLFDGNRTIADVLEDSSFRVFETLRVASRAVEVGLLRRVQTSKPKAAHRAVLAVEEWLVGAESKDAVIERTMQLRDSEGTTGPIRTVPQSEISGQVGGQQGGDQQGAGQQGAGKKKNRGKKKKVETAPVRALPEIDWASLLPRSTTVDMTSITGVVPSASQSGEIVTVTGEEGGAMAARREGREGLEALTDAGLRTRMFPESEPSVTVDLGPEPAPEAPAPVPVPVPVPVPAPDPAPEEPPGPSTEKIERINPEDLDDPDDSDDSDDSSDDSSESPAEASSVPEPPAEASAVPDASGPPPRQSGEIRATVPSPDPVIDAGPSILVDDLAAAHVAVAAVAARELARAATPRPDTHDPATSAEISAVRMDAVAFSDDEEAFFKAGHTLEQKKPVVSESFADLDEGYRPEGFWERLRGKRDTRKPGK